MKIFLIIYLTGVIFSIYKSIQRMMSYENEIIVLDLLQIFTWSLISWVMLFVFYYDQIGNFLTGLLDFLVFLETKVTKIEKIVVWRKKNTVLPGGDKLQHPIHTTINIGGDK
jgi:hypothetical protein